MFEQIKSGDDGISFDAPTICFALGWLPFIIAWAVYNTAFTEWLVQTYFITIMVFINYPRWYERKNLAKAWFWKGMSVAFIAIHPVILSLMWLADLSTKSQWHDSATMTSICAITGILEFAILDRILNFFRPAREIAHGSHESSDA